MTFFFFFPFFKKELNFRLDLAFAVFPRRRVSIILVGLIHNIIFFMLFVSRVMGLIWGWV